ncbi:hypothetical protein B0J11DRAFT_426907 [Dendryphion nanum]|uniref:Fe2OG dioxygenase domain-containing protein n=1 Tax=Dendryphion nanum TaxID=256645 RepID=A0A9P9ECT9_9PLEO|nr:hypothetical protein B0J11DRAFT_426907 [Dendryphion nanum]
MQSARGTTPNRLESYRIQTLPPNFYYIHDFITTEEEASLLQKIPSQRWISLSHRRLQAHPSTLTKSNTLLGAPLPQYLVNPIVDRFKTLGIFDHTPHKGPNHVLINEYRRGEGIMPHEDGNAYADAVATISLGSALCLDIIPKSVSDEERAMNDEETNAAGGFEKNGTLSSVPNSPSLQHKLPTRILQEPRSLLVTTSGAYMDLLHGISPIEVDENLNSSTVANWGLLASHRVFEQTGGLNERGTRISLTYRDVLKVSSAANKVFGGPRK